jgi:Flp pilus assembly protein TadD
MLGGIGEFMRTVAVLVAIAAGLGAQVDSGRTAELMGRVDRAVRENRSKDAIAMLQAELAAVPGDRTLQLALGNTAVRTGEYDLAITTFQGLMAETEGPARGDIYLRIGETYRRKGDKEAAITNLRQAAELLTDNVVVMSTLGLVLDGAGRMEEAVREYRAVVRMDPNNGVVLNNLRYLLAQSGGGDLDEALDYAERAYTLLPGLSEISDTLGWIHLKKNRTSDAIAAFDRIVQKEQNNPTFRYHLGMALLQKGDRSASKEQFQAALKCNPADDMAEKVKTLLEKMQ